MKKRLMMIAAFALAVCNMVNAEDWVTISDFQIAAGETKEVSISLNNDAAYVAFQFDLYLPAGITVEAYSANRSRMPESTALSMSQQADGSYRFLAAAMQGEPIAGNSGAIVNLTVKAAEWLVHGERTGFFRQVKLVKADATGPTYAEMPFTVKIVGGLVVTVTSCSRQYGDANPTFEYTVTGGTLNGIPEISCEATRTSPVGTYPIVVGRGTVTNHDVIYVSGTLTIEQAPLTISAGTYTKQEGDPIPAFTLTYEGFKNNETNAVLTKQPVVTCEATADSGPGEYPVIVSGAEARNYKISYVAGVLIVEQMGEIGDPEPYAVLTNDNTRLTFYYDGNNARRGGMSIGPFNSNDVRWDGHHKNITTIVFDASFASYTSLTSTAYWFCECTNLKTIVGIENLKTSNVTDMERMFSDCYALSSLDLSHFDTSKVTTMKCMFYCCFKLTNVDVSHFNTSNVANMYCMFAGCYDLTSLDVSHFNTSKVTNMSCMFYYCKSLTSLDLSHFDTSKVINSYMFFNNCNSMNTLRISSTMGNISDEACDGVGSASTPCLLIATKGFNFGVDTSGNFFIWKKGYFRLDEELSIDDVQQAENARDFYNPNGKKLDKPQKGLNIMVMQDGTVKKVYIK